MTTEFSQEQIDKWTAEGHWPPPVGMTILPEVKVDPENVKKFAGLLANILPPAQGNLVRKLFKID